MPYPKIYPFRDAIYELLGNGYMQRDILMLLKEKGFILGKSRLSQIIRDLGQEEYITCGFGHHTILISLRKNHISILVVVYRSHGVPVKNSSSAQHFL